MVGVGKGLLGDLPCLGDRGLGLRGKGCVCQLLPSAEVQRCTPSLRPNISSTLACLQQDNSICTYTISRFLNGIGNGNMFSWGWEKIKAAKLSNKT